MRIVPDTSVIVDGRITRLVEDGDLEGAEILVPEAVVAELEAQANRGRETGLAGLDELARLQDMAITGHIKIRFVGDRPSLEAIELAASGEIDAMIRDVAAENEAKLLTSDRVLAAVCGATGIEYSYIRPETGEEAPEIDELALLKYFDDGTMSVHLKAEAMPHAKKGTPGDIHYGPVDGARRLDHKTLSKMSNELIEAARRDAASFVEIEREGCTVLQLGPMRIVITRPPFSDALEITAVRPVARLTLDEYGLDDRLVERLTDYNRGVMVSGPPGSGKSTLAQAVADHLHGLNRVIKTMESPRDLQLHEEITQYAPLEKDMALTGDVILLVRPDYVIFDEVRRTEDFEVYADMRLAGIGLIGVTHANRAIDAVQRLIGRVELGMIPQVVDTVVHIQGGEVDQVLQMKFDVRVPTGMTEADLARPVILVSDFQTNKELFEIYTYGEQVVVMPISGKKAKKKGSNQLAEDQLWQLAKGWVHGDVEVELVDENKAKIYVEESEVPRLIGKGGENIKRLEKEVGLSLDVEGVSGGRFGGPPGKGKGVEITPNLVRTKKEVILYVQPEFANSDCVVSVDGDDVFTGTVSRKGEIRIRKGTNVGKRILSAHAKGRSLRVRM